MAETSTIRLSPRFPLFIEYATAKRETELTQREFQIILLQDGRVRCSGREPVVLTGPAAVVAGGGSGIFVSAGSRYWRVMVGRSLLEHLAVGLWDDPAVETLLTVGEGKSTAVGLSLPDDSIGAVTRICADLRLECRSPAGSMARLKLMELVVRLAQFARVPAHGISRPRAVWNMEDVIGYLEENYAEPISLAQISSLCALNPTYLSRSFKEAAGVPLFEYLNRIRIRKACVLLKRSNRTVLDIAFTVGYNNVSFFNRYFRKIMKMSPTEYRRDSAKTGKVSPGAHEPNTS